MTVNIAPLTEPVLTLLQGQLLNIVCTAPVNAAQPIEEQYLLSRLGLKLHSETVLSADLARFQQHFVLYHLLYRLQQQMLALEQGYLSIELAKVRLLPLANAAQQLTQRQQDTGRRQYYLNWQNYYLMTEQLLDQHLSDFWQQFSTTLATHAELATTDALALLQLPANFTLQQLKKAYRSKALQLHPDRGGEQQQFILLRQAYQQLLLSC